MEKKYILIIFDTNKIITEDVINNAQGLKHKFCDIITYQELLKNKECLLNYKAVLDCTVESNFYVPQKIMKNGIEFTENNIQFIKTSTNKFICIGPNISRLTTYQFNNSKQILENYKKDYKEYEEKINFLISKIPETKNMIAFESAINDDGIILDLEIKNNINKKQYKLVKKIPEQKEVNVEYITYDNIFILNELKNIIDYIK